MTNVDRSKVVEVRSGGETVYRALGGDGVTTYKTPEQAAAMHDRLDAYSKAIRRTKQA
ncbi:hypothetical protein ACIRU8_39345 [Streptomyces sp. NPDC101175]|uniref:hypothetical protein n=1 Tax=Streptomyces sp. NPDC101175 TaxID=3366123 RepID=UPI0038356B88